MQQRLSFVQRLVRQSTSKDHASVDTPHSMEKKFPIKQHTQNSSYVSFKEQHNELQNMLKMLDSPKIQPSSRPQTTTPKTPSKNMGGDKKYDKKKVALQMESIRKEEAKENIYKPMWSFPRKEEAKQSKVAVAAKTDLGIQMKQNHKRINKTEHQLKKGIPNIGNTCYINSLVQCLFHLPHFNDYFVQEKFNVQKNGKAKDVVEMYRSLYVNVMRKAQQAQVSTLPLKRSVSKICSLFIDWEQEDAHQFMKELLNSMHESINRICQKPRYRDLTREMETLSTEKMAAAYWDYYKQRDDSYIYDSLCGQLYNNISCINCDHQSQSFQNFLDLSIPMMTGARSLEDLLQNFFQKQRLSDFYLCSNCKKSTKKSTKTVELWRAPSFLILHLKRNQFSKKNNEPITIPESLNLKKYMNLSNDRSSKYCQYNLCGSTMHRGVLDGGHYWATVKDNGKWFELDDQKVSELNADEFKKELTKIGSSSAYILFYSSLYR